MRWDEISRSWQDYREEVKGKWRRLSDKDLDTIAGRQEHLVGAIQKRYSIMLEDAEDAVSEWLDRNDYA
ncbi:MAG: CsbD family protein [Candidatus Eisenbacteria bacterium]